MASSELGRFRFVRFALPYSPLTIRALMPLPSSVVDVAIIDAGPSQGQIANH
jgi:hypothetical protein